jgi:hypothetical protein
MKNNLDKLTNRTIRRTRGYWYIDGLWEIGYGCLFIIMGTLLYLQAVLPDESPLSDFLGYGFFVLIIFLVIFINWAVGKVKHNLTYPRTGLVTYRREPMNLRTWLLAALYAALAIMAGSVLYALFQVWEPALESIPLLLGFLGAAMMLFIASANGLRRFYLMAAYSILIGFLLGWVGITGMRLLGIYFVFLGIGMLIAGALTLWKYLNLTSSPQEVTSES